MAESTASNQPRWGRVLVWLTLSGSLLAYIRWGSETTAVSSFYFIRRSVPSIWGYFFDGLPVIGNARLLGAVYWVCVATLLLGTLALLWLALEPDAESPGDLSSDP